MWRLFFGMLFLGLSVTAVANDLPPDQMVRQVADQVLGTIRSDKKLQQGDRTAVYRLAEEQVLPYFDFERMTRLAVGRPWREATPQQRQALIKQFQTLLVRTYASALINYSKQKFTVEPLKLNPGDTEVTVQSMIDRPGAAQPINIAYRMEKTPAGWKVYDVAIENVSLVTNYRSSFGSVVSQSGIDGLIKSLEEKNAGVSTTSGLVEHERRAA